MPWSPGFVAPVTVTAGAVGAPWTESESRSAVGLAGPLAGGSRGARQRVLVGELGEAGAGGASTFPKWIHQAFDPGRESCTISP